MCVICHKPKDVKFPSRKTIEDMWHTNPDGAGLMWRAGNKTEWRKGFMKLDEFLAFLDANEKRLESTEVAMHFRITTQGGTNQKNTHPFPMDKGTDIHALAGKCKCVMMHNGNLPVKPRKEKYSDTAELAMRCRESGDPMKYLWSIAEFVGKGNRVIAFGPKATYLIGDWSYGYGYGGWWEDYEDIRYGGKKDEADGFNGITYPYYWSNADQCWKNEFGKQVAFDEVDPCALSIADEKRYWQEYDQRVNDSFEGDEEAIKEYDEWLQEQAEEYEFKHRKEVAS